MIQNYQHITLKEMYYEHELVYIISMIYIIQIVSKYVIIYLSLCVICEQLFFDITKG